MDVVRPAYRGSSVGRATCAGRLKCSYFWVRKWNLQRSNKWKLSETDSILFVSNSSRLPVYVQWSTGWGAVVGLAFWTKRDWNVLEFSCHSGNRSSKTIKMIYDWRLLARTMATFLTSNLSPSFACFSWPFLPISIRLSSYTNSSSVSSTDVKVYPPFLN